MGAKEIKKFFSTGDKPVTTSELITFSRTDKAGYKEISDLLDKQLEDKSE